MLENPSQKRKPLRGIEFPESHQVTIISIDVRKFRWIEVVNALVFDCDYDLVDFPSIMLFYYLPIEGCIM